MIGFQIECLKCGIIEVIVQGKYYNITELVSQCDTCDPNRAPILRLKRRRYKKYERSLSQPLHF